MPASPALARIGASNGAQHTAHAVPSPIHVNQNFFIRIASEVVLRLAKLVLTPQVA
jgi:hypothetical protein